MTRTWLIAAGWRPKTTPNGRRLLICRIRRLILRADKTYRTHLPSAAPESLTSGSPDSGHLLGAAGLGLIGGIALAGVLAVFVFNSFVEESDPAREDRTESRRTAGGARGGKQPPVRVEVPAPVKAAAPAATAPLQIARTAPTPAEVPPTVAEPDGARTKDFRA